MSDVLVDSSVLLDVMTEDPAWGAWSSDAVERLADTSRLVINAVIYAEVSVRFSRTEDLDAVLPGDVFAREAIPSAAAFLAGKCFSLYRGRGGARTSPLPDFLIGAHAAVSGYRLLTRDAARFRTYFPKLEVVAPS